MIIRRLFESRLQAWAQGQGLPIAWENRSFTPPERAIYLRAFLLRGATVSLDLLGAHRRYVGVFQVDVVAPVGMGPGQAEAVAEQICALYPMSLRLTEGSFTAIVTAPMALAQPLPEPDAYTVPVSCRYRADHY